MITICGGWKDVNGRPVHLKPLVLVPDDGKDAQISHGICLACRDAFLERAELVQREKEEEHARRLSTR